MCSLDSIPPIAAFASPYSGAHSLLFGFKGLLSSFFPGTTSFVVLVASGSSSVKSIDELDCRRGRDVDEIDCFDLPSTPGLRCENASVGLFISLDYVDVRELTWAIPAAFFVRPVVDLLGAIFVIWSIND